MLRKTTLSCTMREEQRRQVLVNAEHARGESGDLRNRRRESWSLIGAAKLASLEGHGLLQTIGARDGCAGAMAERARGEEAERSLAERLVHAA